MGQCTGPNFLEGHQFFSKPNSWIDLIGQIWSPVEVFYMKLISDRPNLLGIWKPPHLDIQFVIWIDAALVPCDHVYVKIDKQCI